MDATKLAAIGATQYAYEGDRRPFMAALAAWLRECGCHVHGWSVDGGTFTASRWDRDRMRRSPVFEVVDNGGEMSGRLVNWGDATHYDIPTVSWGLARTVEDVAADLLAAVEAVSYDA